MERHHDSNSHRKQSILGLLKHFYLNLSHASRVTPPPNIQHIYFTSQLSWPKRGRRQAFEVLRPKLIDARHAEESHAELDLVLHDYRGPRSAPDSPLKAAAPLTVNDLDDTIRLPRTLSV
jgi:hypothetical protein